MTSSGRCKLEAASLEALLALSRRGVLEIGLIKGATAANVVQSVAADVEAVGP